MEPMWPIQKPIVNHIPRLTPDGQELPLDLVTEITMTEKEVEEFKQKWDGVMRTVPRRPVRFLPHNSGPYLECPNCHSANDYERKTCRGCGITL